MIIVGMREKQIVVRHALCSHRLPSFPNSRTGIEDQPVLTALQFYTWRISAIALKFGA